MNKQEYVLIRDQGLATTLSYLTNEKYFIFDDKFEKDKKVYSFVKTEKFKKALELIPSLRKQFINT